MDDSPSVLQQPQRSSFLRTRWWGEFVLLFFILYYTLAATILLFMVHDHPRTKEFFKGTSPASNTSPSTTLHTRDAACLYDPCRKQQDIATLLALFAGFVAADQWYAHHWILAVLKSQVIIFVGLVCWGIWLRGKQFQVWQITLQSWLIRGLLGLAGWWSIDLAFWVVGVYGTPGCPVGKNTGD
ncbi:hypothetical protein QBC45DRAFT_242351 [Copromyces sp. CBS 386.78]|nr:hypothetical protein QBC45DRAFT_242351 [Copromyces sp. CBS 386.78]